MVVLWGIGWDVEREGTFLHNTKVSFYCKASKIRGPSNFLVGTCRVSSFACLLLASQHLFQWFYGNIPSLILWKKNGRNIWTVKQSSPFFKISKSAFPRSVDCILECLPKYIWYLMKQNLSFDVLCFIQNPQIIGFFLILMN